MRSQRLNISRRSAAPGALSSNSTPRVAFFTPSLVNRPSRSKVTGRSATGRTGAPMGVPSSDRRRRKAHDVKRAAMVPPRGCAAQAIRRPLAFGLFTDLDLGESQHGTPNKAPRSRASRPPSPGAAGLANACNRPNLADRQPAAGRRATARGNGPCPPPSSCAWRKGRHGCARAVVRIQSSRALACTSARRP